MAQQSSRVLGRFARTFGANSFGQAVGLLLQLAFVPLYLLAFGTDEYSDWLILSTIPAYLAGADLGIGDAAANRIVIETRRGRTRQAQQTYSSSWALLTSASVLLGTIFLLIFASFGTRSLLALHSIHNQDAFLALISLTVYTWVAQQATLFQAAMRVADRNATGILVLNSTRLCEAALSVAAALTFHSITLAAAGLLVGRAAGIVVLGIFARRSTSGLQVRLRLVSLAALKELFRPSTAYIGMFVGNLAMLQGLLLVVSHVAPPSAVVTLSVLRTLARFVTQIVGIVEATLAPEVSLAYADENRSVLRRTHSGAVAMTSLLASAGAITYALLAPPFVSVWTGGSVQTPIEVVVLLAVDTVLTAMWTTTMMLQVAINIFATTAWRYAAISIACLILSVPLIASLGDTGAATAMVVCDLVTIPFAISRTQQLLRQSNRDFISHMSPKTLMTLATELRTRAKSQQ